MVIGNNVLGIPFALEREFGSDGRVVRNDAAAEHRTRCGLQGRLDIGGCGAWRKVAADHDERTGCALD